MLTVSALHRSYLGNFLQNVMVISRACLESVSLGDSIVSEPPDCSNSSLTFHTCTLTPQGRNGSCSRQLRDIPVPMAVDLVSEVAVSLNLKFGFVP